jgi:hypothetical protein
MSHVDLTTCVFLAEVLVAKFESSLTAVGRHKSAITTVLNTVVFQSGCDL